MPNNDDYRLYLEQCFKGIHQKLDAIVEQTTKTNHRVNKLEDTTFKRQTDVDDFRNLERDYCVVKNDIKDIKADLEEYRLFKKHPALGIILITIFVVGMALSALQTIKSIGGDKDNKEIIDKVKDLEYRFMEVYGVSSRTRSAGKTAPSDTNNLNIYEQRRRAIKDKINNNDTH